MKIDYAEERFALKVRSGLKAGRTVCVNIPDDPNYPIVPPNPTPNYPSGPGPWLNCKSCRGTKVAEGRLQNAKCELCTL